jgi:CelD/BcsL family acetyltransferase involved in cellulose biosynthesis
LLYLTLMLAVPETGSCPAKAMEMRLTRADPARLPAVTAWSSLAKSANEPNPFFEHWFLTPAIKHLPSDAPVWIAEFWDGPDLCGLLPLTTRDNYGRMPAKNVGNWAHYQCFMGTPLIAEGYETAFWRALLLALDDADWAPGFLSITGLEPEGPVDRAMIAAAKSLGRASPIVHTQQRAALRSTLSAGAYLEAHVRSKKRKEWRRLQNRLSEMGTLGFVTLDSAEQLSSWCDTFLALESAGWKGERGAALGNTAETRAFFAEMMSSAFEAGILAFHRLDLDGRAIAMLINFHTPPGSWSFKIAYDEELARFSPGVMIELRNLDTVLGDPALDWMDSCAVENHPMIDSLWAERRTIVQISVPLKGLRRGLTYRACRTAETASATLKSALGKGNRT